MPLISRELFAEHVETALRMFYDPVRLRASPLADLLQPRSKPGHLAPDALRRILRDAMEALKPAALIPVDRPEWYGYRILSLRYTQARGWASVCEDMGLSQASYFRHHRKALDALTEVLWRGYRTAASEPQDEGVSPVGEAEFSATDARDLVAMSTHGPVELHQVLQNTRHIMTPVLEQRGMSLRLETTSTIPALHGDEALFRQIILSVFMEAIKFVAGREMGLSLDAEGGDVILRYGALGTEIGGLQDLYEREGLCVGLHLLAAYGGHLAITEDGGHNIELQLVFPVQQRQTVLVVDDDPDTAHLYRRYLHGYSVDEAHTAPEVRQCLEARRPCIVLLDLVMPQKDGWDVLSELKSSSLTASIPVVVCSVLSQPELALAMGAAEVLHKPISRQSLRQAVLRHATPPERGD